MHKLKTMHLFSGAGGGLLADLILGHTPIVAVEWDKHACEVLRQTASEWWFPELRVWEGDVRDFDPTEYAGVVDCIHAGFPCQDISNAGNKAGIGSDTRSGLYREVLRIASIVRPQTIFLENVASITSRSKSYLEVISQDIFEIGYNAQWLCLSAADVGANHKRERWWCMARMANTDTYKSSRLPVREDAKNAITGISSHHANMGDTKHAGFHAAEVTGCTAQGSHTSKTGAE